MYEPASERGSPANTCHRFRFARRPSTRHCTTALSLSESDETWPLLLDRPEDDLDSRSIYEVIVPYLTDLMRDDGGVDACFPGG